MKKVLIKVLRLWLRKLEPSHYIDFEQNTVNVVRTEAVYTHPAFITGLDRDYIVKRLQYDLGQAIFADDLTKLKISEVDNRGNKLMSYSLSTLSVYIEDRL